MIPISRRVPVVPPVSVSGEVARIEPGTRRRKNHMRTPTDDFTPIEARCVGTAKLLHLFQYHFARRLFRAGTLEDAALILEQGWAPQFFNPPVPANAAAGSLIASPEAKKKP